MNERTLSCEENTYEPQAPRQHKRLFTRAEDELLMAAVRQLGHKHWTKIAARIPRRDARQCRERWVNYLDPELSRTPWTTAEDDILRAKFIEFGSKWVKISNFLPGRSPNGIKNRAFFLERSDRQDQRATLYRWKGLRKADDPVKTLFGNATLDIFEDELSRLFSIS
jgi:hypothetical protein